MFAIIGRRTFYHHHCFTNIAVSYYTEYQAVAAHASFLEGSVVLDTTSTDG